MASIDIKNNVGPVQSTAPAAYTASANGSSADLQDFEGALVLIDAGLWTDGTHTFAVEESSDDSSFSAVANADLLGSEPVVDSLTSDGQIYRLGYIGSKRYIRVAVTVASATSGAVYGASIVRGAPRSAPVA